jgi:putative tricarboxylic transport membrane protein
MSAAHDSADPPIEPATRGRRVIAGVCVLVSAAYLAITLIDLQLGTLRRPGAGIFPLCVGAAFLLVSVVTLFRAGGFNIASLAANSEPTGKARLVRFCVLIAVYVGCLPVAGHAVSNMLLVTMCIRLLSSRSWPYALAVATILTAFIWLLFVVVLEVPLPRGLFAPR